MLKSGIIDLKTKDIKRDKDLWIRQMDYNSSVINDSTFDCFSEEDLQRFQRFISPKRKNEYYFTRLLWKSMFPNLNITYDKLGKPCILRGYVSISHSAKSIVIGYSEKYRIGVDIEYFSGKILRVADKFMGKEEKLDFGMNNEKVLTKIWSTKETMFKLFPEYHLNFAQQIRVLSFDNNSECSVLLDKKQRIIPFNVIENEQSVITYSVDR